MNIVLKNRYLYFGLLLFLNIVILILSLQFVPLMFDSTDDVAMCYIANGHFFGYSESRLVFINAIFGELLCFLYINFPAVEWYSLSFLILQIISFSIIEYFILKNFKNKYLLTLLLLFCLVMWCRSIVGFQFTTAAGVVCLAGCLLLMGKHVDTKCFGIILVTIASLIRFNMAAFVGVVFCPLIFYSYKKDIKQYISLVCLLLIVVGCKFIDQSYYKSTDWSTYIEYNHLRSGINDNPNSNILFHESFDSISNNDVLMALGTEQDPSISDCNILEEMNGRINDVTKWSRFLKVYQLKFFFLPLILLGLFALIFVCASTNNIKWIPIISLVIFVSFLCYISIHNFLKPRAVIPVIMTLVFLSAFCYNVDDSNKKTLLVSMLTMSCGFISIYLFETVQIGKNWNNLVTRWECQKDMIQRHDNPVLWPSDLCEAGMSPMHIKDNKIEYVAAGWMLQYPKEQVLHNHKELLSKSIGIMLSKEHDWDKLIISHYITSLQEHYGITAKDSLLEEDENYRYYVLKQAE